MSTSSKKQAAKAIAKGGRNKRSARERKDESIMNTNDSSIVSKRSVSKLYFPKEPDFYQPFVTKFVRRNPLINRGYWLRMHAVEQVVRQFLEEELERPKVIVNLGCGYDPLPFQIWHRYPTICENVMFVDVDYPDLIKRKRDRMLTSNLLRDELLQTNLRPAKDPVYLCSDRYLALGCDLRDLQTLEQVLKTECGTADPSFLFVAEVSITYMPTSDSDALIRWASTLTEARFCLLEQYLPQGPDHPFAMTMLKHFNKLHTPIHAVNQYPSLAQQESRFIELGWSNLQASRNLWGLWGDEDFTPAEIRRSLDKVEPFDEWEEFALFAGHYFLLVASNGTSNLPKPVNRLTGFQPDELYTDNANARRISLAHHYEFPESNMVSRRFGVAIALDDNTIALHGGQGPQSRLGSIDVLSRNGSNFDRQILPSIEARICHTMTSLNTNETLMVGGRKSPSLALNDCWILKSGLWQREESLEPGRFRHSSVKVSISPNEPGSKAVLVYGGKTSDGIVLEDWCLWRSGHGWNKLSSTTPRPQARFGATLSTSTSSPSRGILMGGMDADGTILDDVWEWELTSGPEVYLKFVDLTPRIKALSLSPSYARFGAYLVPFGESLLLFGGVSKNEITSVQDDFMLISEVPDFVVHRSILSTKTTGTQLLVAASVVAVSKDEILILGGGAVCFSMGSFLNKGGYISLSLNEERRSPWSICLPQADQPTPAPEPTAANRRKEMITTKKKQQALNPNSHDVPRIQLYSKEDFLQVIAASKPLILEGLELGPCAELWTIDYLKQKIGEDREIVIHECDSDRMTFKDKNFQYVKKSVGEFLDGISKGAKTYLRAASKTQPNKLPTKLEDDFPTIAPDFRVPDILTPVLDGYHSSPLRISGPVSLWLHYDVLANVLCQIRGRKTLRLYSPSDIRYLNFPPGGSSSNINVLTSKDPKLRHTHPHIATLNPGDVLFIPSMWSHTATPEEGISVAVNVFFRNLSSGYAAGKDVYGNRDLQAYENGRRDVEKIAKAFRDVPDELAKFYLERLAMEIQDRADRIGK
ncbi:hypothetical protein BCR34DRAFT_367310 [Clohesyomyces aquaticus]|uniref:tRNA wybutosine-synthesizing protein 4 n=1 Tax=Clohesyomyces aquaticus TaxID=1231657 RepID=A0A1Y1ZHE1_9PLEO|nr:hypothetical protein BCR34DRAFT_367310 [Clohesyomyces aquaticus]